MAEIKDRYKEIPIKDIIIGKIQTRTRDVGKNIDDLAASIKKIGLLQPIAVAPVPNQDNKYEIILGQRRYLACKKLQKEMIPCTIFDENIDPIEAKVISFSENILREGLHNLDIIDICTSLYKKYDSIPAVASETGIPQDLVSRYVKYDQLNPKLKKKVDSGQIAQRNALRVQRAAAATGLDDPEQIANLAMEFNNLTPTQQKAVEVKISQQPEIQLDDAVKDAKKAPKTKKINIELLEQEHARLKQYASKEGMKIDEAAIELIMEGLDLNRVV
jgi:ParB family transcriptional regulator, chromosome partitioning protein